MEENNNYECNNVNNYKGMRKMKNIMIIQQKENHNNVLNKRVRNRMIIK